MEFGVEVSPDGLRDTRQWQAWSDVANSWRGTDDGAGGAPHTARTLDDQLNGNNENLLDYWGGTDIRDADGMARFQQYQQNLRHNADAKVDDYLNISWDYLLGLATSGEKLSDAEKAEAKAAIDILKSKYGSAYSANDRTALAMLLENKSSTGNAIAAGVYDSLPAGEWLMNKYIDYTQNGDYLNSQYDDARLINAP